jgi:hypothetical protein
MTIHGSLNDVEYATDVKSCEVYKVSTKRVIYKATRESTVDYRLLWTVRARPLHHYPHTPNAPTIKLVNIKLEHFSGDIESWPRFGRIFSRLLTLNFLSQINKHVFLRGDWKGEPKRLVDMIAVIEMTYEETQRILHATHGNKIRITQVHLDYI